MKYRGRNWAWMEEYEKCGCTFLMTKKRELLGYCREHGNNRRRVWKVPFQSGELIGHASR